MLFRYYFLIQMKNRNTIIALILVALIAVISLFLVQIIKGNAIDKQHIIANCFYGELNSELYSVIIFVSPMDCYSCSEYVLSEQFHTDLIRLGNEKGKKTKLYYVIYGGFSDETKNKYMSKSSKNAKLILKQKCDVKLMLKKSFKTGKTPLMMVVDNANRIIHWQGFIPDEVTVFRELRTDLLNKLGEVL